LVTAARPRFIKRAILGNGDGAELEVFCSVVPCFGTTENALT